MDCNLKDKKINKDLQSICKFVYKMTQDGEIKIKDLRKNVKIVHKDPDDLLVYVD